jgi:hypothetical protein
MTANIQTSDKFPYVFTTTAATIASGSVSSGAVDLRGTQLQAIVTPGSLNGTTFTFYASADGTTYNAVTNMQGTAVSATVAASKYVLVDPTLNWRGVRWAKLVSSTTETASRTITLVSTP